MCTQPQQRSNPGGQSGSGHLSGGNLWLTGGCGGGRQVVIFLYLLDNETSFVILASTFVGILIEFWKARNQTVPVIHNAALSLPLAPTWISSSVLCYFLPL